MKGYPNFLNTKEDYEYARAYFPKEKWVKDFKHLLSTMSHWYFVSKLNKKSDGYEDETHKIVEIPDSDNKISYAQYELRVNPECKLFKLGYTEKEVRAIIDTPK